MEAENISVHIMELLQLSYFCSAAETENFAKTAKIYGVPSTGVSQSVRRLEKELGVTLFDRVSNGIKLNERGRIFYQNIKSSLDILNTARKKVCEDEVSGKIDLLVITNRHYINRVMIEFSELYKNVTFNIDYQKKKHNDEYDLIITDNLRWDASYDRFRLVEDEIVLALNKNHPLAKKENIHPLDFKEEKLITYSEDTGLYTITRHICKEGDFNPKVCLRVDDLSSIAKAVENGIGIALVPQFAFEGLYSNNVCIKHFTNKERITVVAFNKQKYMSKPTKIFLDMLLERIKKENKNSE